MRYKEIDLLRALAIILMIAYHVAYDLQVYAGLNTDYQGTFWSVDGKLAALLFIFLSGLCSGVSHNPGKRGLLIFSCGMGITLVTYLFIRPEYIRFGILHFLGVAMLLAPLLRRMPGPLLLTLALFSAYIGLRSAHTIVTVQYLFPLGLRDSAFQSADYYPLFPYLSVTILGILAYKYIYTDRFQSAGPSPEKASLSNIRSSILSNEIIQRLSKNSLAIYLVHQPVILGGLFAAIYLIHNFNNIKISHWSVLPSTWLPAGLFTIAFIAYKIKFRRT